ncbi:MAG: DHH family phosphoesterase [Nanoarchaeota archaeon]|nr:DHH family phosphoesterase [Nanoarchaeota archaeon]
MPKITFQEAKDFLNNITDKDKVAVIHHDDGDGFCSGILYFDWCKKRDAEVEQFTYSIRKSKIRDFDLKNFNKVIVCDLASGFIAEELYQIEEKEILYTDHHPRESPLPKKVLELVTIDQGYIPSSRTAGELTKLKPWLSLTGTINDSGELYPENQDFIDKNLKQINMTLEDFKENISSKITNFLVYFHKDFNKAFKILQKINTVEEIFQLKKYSDPVEDEVQKFVEQYEDKKEKLGNVNFYYFEPTLPIKAPICGIIGHRDANQVYIFATPKSDGKHITLSARSAPKKMNVCKLLKAGTVNLEESAAGGHNSAAGGIILAKDIERFKTQTREALKNQNFNQ